MPPCPFLPSGICSSLPLLARTQWEPLGPCSPSTVKDAEAQPTPPPALAVMPTYVLLTENLSAPHRRTWGREGELRCQTESSMVATQGRIKEPQKSNPAGLQRVWVCLGSHPQRLLPAALNTGKSEEMVADHTLGGCWVTPQLGDLPQLISASFGSWLRQNRPQNDFLVILSFHGGQRKGIPQAKQERKKTKPRNLAQTSFSYFPSF